MRTRAKWTPGLWTMKRLSNSIIAIYGQDGHAIAHVLQPGGRDEQKANAHLIAAAPEMEELLKLISVSECDCAFTTDKGKKLQTWICASCQARSLLTKINGQDKTKETA